LDPESLLVIGFCQVLQSLSLKDTFIYRDQPKAEDPIDKINVELWIQISYFLNALLEISAYVCTVRGYLPAPPEVKKNLMDLNVEQETLRELAARFRKN
jgi:hypothetical protein